MKLAQQASIRQPDDSLMVTRMTDSSTRPTDQPQRRTAQRLSAGEAGKLREFNTITQ